MATSPARRHPVTVDAVAVRSCAITRGTASSAVDVGVVDA